jgi:hypothetical protein
MPRRADQDEAVHTRLVTAGERHRDHPADRAAGEMGTRDAQLVERVDDAVGKTVDGVRPG